MENQKYHMDLNNQNSNPHPIQNEKDVQRNTLNFKPYIAVITVTVILISLWCRCIYDVLTNKMANPCPPPMAMESCDVNIKYEFFIVQLYIYYSTMVN
jgi:hypothetical protein